MTNARQRLPLSVRTAADTTGEVQELLTKFEQRGKVPLMVSLLANSDTALEPFTRLGVRLMGGEHLPRPVQEVVILHVAVRRGSHYELVQHLDIARSVGVPESKVEAVVRDSGAVNKTIFDDDDLLAVELADQVLESRHIDHTLWSRVVAMWGEAGGVDLILTVAFWGEMAATIIDSLGIYDDNA